MTAVSVGVIDEITPRLSEARQLVYKFRRQLADIRIAKIKVEIDDVEAQIRMGGWPPHEKSKLHRQQNYLYAKIDEINLAMNQTEEAENRLHCVLSRGVY